jgi:hypothetical protein
MIEVEPGVAFLRPGLDVLQGLGRRLATGIETEPDEIDILPELVLHAVKQEPVGRQHDRVCDA